MYVFVGTEQQITLNSYIKIKGELKEMHRNEDKTGEEVEKTEQMQQNKMTS